MERNDFDRVSAILRGWLAAVARWLRGAAREARALLVALARWLERAGGETGARLRPAAARTGAWLRAAGARAGVWLRAGTARAGRGMRRVRPQYALGGVALLVAAAALLYGNCGVTGCPDIRTLTAYQPGGAPVLLDRHGERFADLAPYERVVISLDSLPPHVANAFIAVEDRRFWRHNGVDWVRVFGAAAANVRARGVTQGSSTISMQLARNIFPRELPGTERTFKRKLQEARVAQLIERRFSKAEILELYLNHIYFGGGAYGVEAAARLYFGKPAAELTLAESATLAALPKAPSHYDPRRQAARSEARRNLVLGLMEEQRLIDAEAAQQARETELAVRTNGSRNRESVPLGFSFIDAIRESLEDQFGESLYRSRLRIHTTLDPVAQAAAERELTRQLDNLSGRVRRGEGELQGAVVVLEAATGDVLALVGARDPTTSRYNRAINARRQVGSAFKPFVFAAALQDGIPTSQLVADMPLRMQLSRNDVWEPSNYDGTFEGNVSLRHALVRSRNIPTVRLANAVGLDDVAQVAQNAGVTARMDVTPALSLGTVAMSPLQLATSYTTFANLGRTAEARFVLRVEDEHGRLLWQPRRTQQRQGLDPAVAYIVTDILRDAVDYGTGTGVRSAGYRGVAAGKTGTTNNATDAWFVGYTPDVVGAVWIGYDRPTPLGSAATGGGFAAPVWGRVMRQVYTSRPAAGDWAQPGDVVHRRIDPYSGLVLQDGCQTRDGSARVEIFVATHVPDTACPYRDFWSDFWNRVGGVFGRGGRDEARNERDNVLRGGRDVQVESEPRRGPPAASQQPPGRGNQGQGNPGRGNPGRGNQGRGNQEDAAREQERAIEEFLRRRSEELRRRGGD